MAFNLQEVLEKKKRLLFLLLVIVLAIAISSYFIFWRSGSTGTGEDLNKVSATVENKKISEIEKIRKAFDRNVGGFDLEDYESYFKKSARIPVTVNKEELGVSFPFGGFPSFSAIATLSVPLKNSPPVSSAPLENEQSVNE